MPFRIQKVAAGLQRALGLYDLGRGLAAIDENVRGTFDVRAMFLARDISTASTITDPVQNVGDSAIVTVPQGQVWSLIGAGWTLSNLTAGNVVSVATDLISGQGTLAQPIDGLPATTVAATEVLSSGILFPQPIVVESGAAIRVRLRLTQANTARLANIVSFWRLA